MNCPRCNTELPDSAIFCVQCGSTIRPAPFSYLHTGTPAWPKEPLKSTQYRDGTPLEPALYAVQEEASSAVSSKVASPKKTKLGIPAIIGLCVLSILIGGGLTFGILYINGQRLSIGPQPALKPLQLPTPGTSSTPASQGNQLPTPTAFQSATSKDLGISLQFPSDWVQDPAQTTASGNKSVNFHPQQSLPVSMFIAKLSANVSAQVTDTNEVNQANIQGFGSNYNLLNFKALTNTPQHRTIGGINWDEQDATYTTSSGLLIHVVSISVKHNAIYYNILFFAPDSAYDEAFQKYYSQMLNSFKFS
jgi:zinc ribbon protein